MVGIVSIDALLNFAHPVALLLWSALLGIDDPSFLGRHKVECILDILEVRLRIVRDFLHPEAPNGDVFLPFVGIDAKALSSAETCPLS
jgi:hypothetical protein